MTTALKVCVAEGCSAPADTMGGARGWCSKHYSRWARGQSVEGRSRYDFSLEERFWLKVDRRSDDGCWEWQGFKDAKGYGRFRGGDEQRAHRFAHQLLVGPIPLDLTTDHLCGNQGCVNPAHLELVTRAENTRRARARRPRQMYCKRGHPLFGSNMRMSRGGRCCRQCDRERYVARRSAA